MKKITLLSKWIVARSSARTIVPAVLCVVVLIAVMEAVPFSTHALQRLSGGHGMLDMDFGYSPLFVRNFLTVIGSAGRAGYSSLLALDSLFALAFAVAQSLMISRLHRAAGLSDSFRALNLVPFMRAVLDLMENALLLSVLALFSVFSVPLAVVASSVTILKWVVYYAIIAVFCALGVLSAVRASLERRARDNAEALS
jgi:hypothetical protein